MVIGKLKYLIGPASGLFPTLLNSFPGGCRSSHNPKRKGKCCVDDFVPHVCVLDLSCKVNNLDLNRSFLAVIETA
jgi:hypothetical protein